MTDLYFEDVEIGSTLTTATHAVTADDIARFADLTRDHHPLHTDAAYSRTRGFPGVIAHGLFCLSLMEGLKSELRVYERSSIASLGWDAVRFRKPVVAGDRLTVQIRFLSKRLSRTPGRGVVREALQLVNQDGETVIEAEHASLLVTRHASCRDPDTTPAPEA